LHVFATPATLIAVQRQWLAAIWDLCAFAGGLALARWQQWQARDLIWSLWLSSLVVGYCSILWMIGRMAAPAFLDVRAARVRAASAGTSIDISKTGSSIGLLVVSAFMVAFFTFHFGMFHIVHSVFLNTFFPVDDTRGFPGLHTYANVVGRYWPFLPAAFVAERAIFTRPRPTRAAGTGAAPRANPIKAAADANSGAMMEPYKNVMRMHLMIFLLIGASTLRFDNFRTVALIYGVYFFPWSLLRRRSPDVAAGLP
jgi:hypothetical protein